MGECEFFDIYELIVDLFSYLLGLDLLFYCILVSGYGL